MNKKASNILAGVVEDATWSFIKRFMERYGIFIEGVRNGDRLEAVLSTPKFKLELQGRIVPRENETAK